MELKDLDELYQYKEENMRIINKNKMLEVLKYFYYLCKKNKIEYYSSNSIWDSFYINYQNLVNINLYEDIRIFMKQKQANEMAFIYEYLHYINQNNELTNDNEIRKKHFKVENAKDYFKNTNLESIFSKKLEGECFDRTLDIVSKLQDSRAVVTYLPNLFQGGFYHAYVKCSDGSLINPASNFVIKDELTKQLLKGTEIISMTYEEIKNTYQELSIIEGITTYDRPILLKIALYEELKAISNNKKLK